MYFLIKKIHLDVVHVIDENNGVHIPVVVGHNGLAISLLAGSVPLKIVVGHGIRRQSKEGKQPIGRG